MSDTEYIETLREKLNSMVSVTPCKHNITYRTETVLPRTFELKFADADLDGYCSFTVSTRNLGHHHTVKVIAHTYDGTKLDSKMFKDISADDAIKAISGLAASMYDYTLSIRDKVSKFRHDIVKGFTELGYSTQCNSRYMVGMATKKKSIIVTISASGAFKADLKYIHGNSRSGERRIYTTSGPISDATAMALVDAFRDI